MERCPNCGNKLSNIDVLCPRCGTVVEVIQIKSSIATDAAASAVADSSAKKKDFPQSFIVYNEDFPVEESKEPRDTVSAAGSDVAPEVTQTPPDGIDAAAGSSILNRYKKQLDEMDEGSTPEVKHTEVEKEFDNDYSSRYLENLMNIDLPEIDDLQDFDPEKFMQEYRSSKKGAAPSEAAVSPKKRWLELEEADTPDEATPAARQPEPSAEPAEQRRYRSTAVQERREEVPVRQTKSAEQIKPVSQKPVSQMKKKKANVLASVLLWVLVTAAFFFCFIFFDKYVQKAYGSYDNLIYSITNGKIDLGPQD